MAEGQQVPGNHDTSSGYDAQSDRVGKVKSSVIHFSVISLIQPSTASHRRRSISFQSVPPEKKAEVLVFALERRRWAVLPLTTIESTSPARSKRWNQKRTCGSTSETSAGQARTRGSDMSARNEVSQSAAAEVQGGSMTQEKRSSWSKIFGSSHRFGRQ